MGRLLKKRILSFTRIYPFVFAKTGHLPLWPEAFKNIFAIS